METVVLAGGCFWCLDAAYKLIKGVSGVISGYAGGHAANPTYEQTSTGSTGHAEVVAVTFDPSIITLDEIFEIFWTIHDPTTLNRQGNDVGTQYRSAIFYANDSQKNTAEASKAQAAHYWDDPIVTEISPLDYFYPAEDYHQDYFANHPEQSYCQIIINPKLQKLKQKFADRIA